MKKTAQIWADVVWRSTNVINFTLKLDTCSFKPLADTQSLCAALMSINSLSFDICMQSASLEIKKKKRFKQTNRLREGSGRDREEEDRGLINTREMPLSPALRPTQITPAQSARVEMGCVSKKPVS